MKDPKKMSRKELDYILILELHGIGQAITDLTEELKRQRQKPRHYG